MTKRRNSEQAIPEGKQPKPDDLRKAIEAFEEKLCPCKGVQNPFDPLSDLTRLLRLSRESGSAEVLKELQRLFFSALQLLIFAAEDDKAEEMAIVNEWAPLADEIGIGRALVLDWGNVVTDRTRFFDDAFVFKVINGVIKADASVVARLRALGLEGEILQIESTIQDGLDSLLEAVTTAVKTAVKEHFPGVDQDPFK
tara:strand:- start:75 stop:665 length:591 start_codon:yes stop_codon:yes gene_type:complete